MGRFVVQTLREEEWAEQMRAALAGDDAAYRAVLHALSQSLRSAIRRGFAHAGAPLNDVEDVLQETLLALHLKRNTWDPEQPLGPWVRAIARHKLIDALRRRGRRIQVPIDAIIGTLAVEEDSSELDRQDAQRLVNGLPSRQRDVVQAISIDGQSIKEVAERLQMKEVAVRVTLHRGLKALGALHREDDRT
ncbi:RNA polymerase sigma-70 factor, ECF subfamily [Hyphomicrobium sulfonivorans]|uniref:RNA polymerase sigma-70 factor, ECF subfamily n=1 Tax=Hyphomicrobium sulfonivorans TaxID=121290 RepID=A0A109BAK2_HYPSL|nr:RNA polymerase sigma-70 factor, ECF subfamily [Hyphomicrobium sulfonivorans]